MIVRAEICSLLCHPRKPLHNDAVVVRLGGQLDLIVLLDDLGCRDSHGAKHKEDHAPL